LSRTVPSALPTTVSPPTSLPVWYCVSPTMSSTVRYPDFSPFPCMGQGPGTLEPWNLVSQLSLSCLLLVSQLCHNCLPTRWRDVVSQLPPRFLRLLSNCLPPVSQMWSPSCLPDVVSQLSPSCSQMRSPNCLPESFSAPPRIGLPVVCKCLPLVTQLSFRWCLLQLSSSYFSLAFRAGARLSLDFEAATAVGLQSWGPIYPPFVGSIRLALMENSVNSNPPALRLRWNPGRLASIVDGCK
jgi:hypothetical protein